jgi:hypothetical protein
MRAISLSDKTSKQRLRSMIKKLPHTETETDGRDLKVRFSPSVTKALRSLASTALNSEHFDQEMHSILQEWSDGKPTTVHDILIAFPLIAEQMAAHISATNDESTKDAWRELCMQLPENGFTISQSVQRKR